MPRLDWRFVASAAALVALSFVPWPGLAAGTVHTFCAASNYLCSAVRLQGVFGIRLARAVSGTPGDAQQWAVDVTILDMQTGVRALVSTLDVKALAYAPLTLFLALMLATPGRLTRAWGKAMGLGLVLTLAFIATSIAVGIGWSLSHVWAVDPSRDALDFLSGRHRHLVELGQTGNWILGAINGAMEAVRYPAAAIIWIITLLVALPRQVGGWLRPLTGLLSPAPRSTPI